MPLQPLVARRGSTAENVEVIQFDPSTAVFFDEQRRCRGCRLSPRELLALVFMKLGSWQARRVQEKESTQDAA